MRVLCAWFPKLDIDIVLRQRPTLAGRPVVLLQGHGDRALVSGVSCEASRLGILPGMSAGQARRRSPGTIFLADNSGACLDELERLAMILRTRVTTRVEVGGRDHLFVAMDGEDHDAEKALALRVMGIVRAWAARPVRGGLAATRADALEAARASRRGMLALPPADAERIDPVGIFRDDEITARREFQDALGGTAARAAVGELCVRLAGILAARGMGARAIAVDVATGAGHVRVRVQSSQPAFTGAELMALVAGQLPPDLLDGAARLEIRLGRLCPDVRVSPLGVANFERADLALAG